MPYYDYVCDNCQHNFEVSQSMNEEALKDCPQCHKPDLRRLFGGAGIIFKGSGYYVTDSKKPACANAGTSACSGGCESKAG